MWKIALARALDGGATFRLARSYSPNAAANGQHASHQSNSEELDILERVDGMRTAWKLTNYIQAVSFMFNKCSAMSSCLNMTTFTL